MLNSKGSAKASLSWSANAGSAKASLSWSANAGSAKASLSWSLFPRGNKGITPIIATILLLMMAIAIAASAFFWTSRMQNQMQGGIESYQSKQLTQLTSSAKIYDADYDSSSENLTIFIQNTGNTRLPIRGCCIWPRTDWILKDANQNIICNTDWEWEPGPTPGGADCIEGCENAPDVNYIEIGQIYKVVLWLRPDCNITDDTIYPSGTVFSFTINFLGQATAGGSFVKP